MQHRSRSGTSTSQIPTKKTNAWVGPWVCWALGHWPPEPLVLGSRKKTNAWVGPWALGSLGSWAPGPLGPGAPWPLGTLERLHLEVRSQQPKKLTRGPFCVRVSRKEVATCYAHSSWMSRSVRTDWMERIRRDWTDGTDGWDGRTKRTDGTGRTGHGPDGTRRTGRDRRNVTDATFYGCYIFYSSAF